MRFNTRLLLFVTMPILAAVCAFWSVSEGLASQQLRYGLAGLLVTVCLLFWIVEQTKE